MASAVPPRTSARPISAVDGDGLVEEDGAVDERERGHEVGDEDRARCAGARDDREVEEVGDARAEHAEGDDGEPHLSRRLRRRELGEAERRHQHRRAGELAERDLQRRDPAHGAAGVEHGARVTESDAEHGERGDEVVAASGRRRAVPPRRSRRDAAEPRSRDALADVDARGEEHGEDRRRGLDHRRQPGRSRVSAKPSSQNGTALLSVAEHDERDEVAAERSEPASAGKQERAGAARRRRGGRARRPTARARRPRA